jgi:hypothetical protein
VPLANLSSGRRGSSTQDPDTELGLNDVTDDGGVGCVELRPMDGTLNDEPDRCML